MKTKTFELFFVSSPEKTTGLVNVSTHIMVTRTQHGKYIRFGQKIINQIITNKPFGDLGLGDG